MFGVGGGIVKGPLMLEMGVMPDVAAATSATMMCARAVLLYQDPPCMRQAMLWALAEPF